jgi:hypothetical protein
LAFVLTLALVLCLLVAGLVVAQAGVERPREVLGAGASESTAGGVSLHATLGQPVVGVISGSGGDIVLGQGFWHRAPYCVYLPLLFRDHL